MFVVGGVALLWLVETKTGEKGGGDTINIALCRVFFVVQDRRGEV